MGGEELILFWCFGVLVIVGFCFRIRTCLPADAAGMRMNIHLTAYLGEMGKRKEALMSLAGGLYLGAAAMAVWACVDKHWGSGTGSIDVLAINVNYGLFKSCSQVFGPYTDGKKTCMTFKSSSKPFYVGGRTTFGLLVASIVVALVGAVSSISFTSISPPNHTLLNVSMGAGIIAAALAAAAWVEYDHLVFQSAEVKNAVITTDPDYNFFFAVISSVFFSIAALLVLFRIINARRSPYKPLN